MMILSGCNIGGVDLEQFMQIFKLIIVIIEYAVPVALILWGSIDLFKAITSGKDDDVKKKQSMLIKKGLAALIILLLPWLVFTVMGLLGNEIGQFGKCYNDTKPGLPSLSKYYKNID